MDLDRFLTLFDALVLSGYEFDLKSNGDVHARHNGDTPLMAVAAQETGIHYSYSEDAGQALGLNRRDAEAIALAEGDTLDHVPPHIARMRQRLLGWRRSHAELTDFTPATPEVGRRYWIMSWDRELNEPAARLVLLRGVLDCWHGTYAVAHGGLVDPGCPNFIEEVRVPAEAYLGVCRGSLTGSLSQTATATPFPMLRVGQSMKLALRQETLPPQLLDRKQLPKQSRRLWTLRARVVVRRDEARGDRSRQLDLSMGVRCSWCVGDDRYTFGRRPNRL